MTALERMARAICAVEAPQYGEWEDYVDTARAALLAIREPEWGVVQIGAESVSLGDYYSDPSEQQIGTAFKVMIDAILNETPE